jgi:hypothetical protein
MPRHVHQAGVDLNFSEGISYPDFRLLNLIADDEYIGNANAFSAAGGLGYSYSYRVVSGGKIRPSFQLGVLRILRFKEYEIVRKDLSFPSSSLAPGLYYGKAGLGVNFFPFSKPLLTILGVGYSLGTRLDGKLLKFFGNTNGANDSDLIPALQLSLLLDMQMTSKTGSTLRTYSTVFSYTISDLQFNTFNYGIIIPFIYKAS